MLEGDFTAKKLEFYLRVYFVVCINHPALQMQQKY